jgi:hypothetical protein
MDAPQPLPLIFANRVIRQFIDHLLGPDMIATTEDFLKMRVVFRRLGGNWSAFQCGDIVQILLLEKVIAAWGQAPDRKRETENT